MVLVVQKFGGSSLADLSRILNAARYVKQAQNEGHQVVVVVSAMFGETDRLLEMAHTLFSEGKREASAHSREADVLVATGEQMSAALMSLALNKLGSPAQSYLGWQLPIITNEEAQKARILEVHSQVLWEAVKSGVIPVVTGFQGVSQKGQITTLGRGGSDLTAIALSAAMQAAECQIFTDVEGVYTADPKIVPQARKLDAITFTEMLEASSLGAKVLQNRCLEFAGQHKVPIRVLSSLYGGEGTVIKRQEDFSEKPRVSVVALDRGQAKLTIRGIPERPGLASYILGPIGRADIAIDMIVQNIPTATAKVDFSFTLHRSDYPKARALMEPVARELSADTIVGHDSVGKLSLVGLGMRSHTAIASKMFSVLGQEGIDIHLIASGETKISAVIDERYLELGARTLHRAFFAKAPSGS